MGGSTCKPYASSRTTIAASRPFSMGCVTSCARRSNAGRRRGSTSWGATIHYIDAFPERVHHPREGQHLFRLLRRSLSVVSAAHRPARGRAPRRRACPCARAGACTLSARRHEGISGVRFRCRGVRSVPILEHMRREERDLLPLASQHLEPSHWRPSTRPLRKKPGVALRTRIPPMTFRSCSILIVRLAPPPIGAGAAHA